jgi:hypothetical protein
MFSEDPKSFRRRALFLAAAALVIVYLLWNIPAFDPILYPLRLFVTYIHEAGHASAALLTGGRVLRFSVSPDGSGLATTAGGSRALILPAGYLGAAFFGAVLFYLTNTVRYSRNISVVIGVGLLIFTTLFARPDQSGAVTAVLVGWIFGFVLIAIGWKLGQMLNVLILNILAMITSLNAVLDLFYLTRAAGMSAGGFRNDAAAFSAEITPIIPPVIWAFVWAGLALLMLATAFYFSVIRPIRRGEF